MISQLLLIFIAIITEKRRLVGGKWIIAQKKKFVAATWAGAYLLEGQLDKSRVKETSIYKPILAMSSQEKTMSRQHGLAEKKSDFSPSYRFPT